MGIAPTKNATTNPFASGTRTALVIGGGSGSRRKQINGPPGQAGETE